MTGWPKSVQWLHVICAVALSGVVALYSPACFAASLLFGIDDHGATVTIDPTTGQLTLQGGGVPRGYYAPVYDPLQNAFYVTGAPINSPDLTDSIMRIDATTGEVTTIGTHFTLGRSIFGLGTFPAAITTPVPEPPTAPLLLGCIVAILTARWHRGRSRMSAR
jgi:hypothetical protein